jgi:hypothetical protein
MAQNPRTGGPERAVLGVTRPEGQVMINEEGGPLASQHEGPEGPCNAGFSQPLHSASTQLH